MPATKKENVYFGLMMCMGMVIMMTTYNLFTNGLIGKISFMAILLQLVLGFVIAFLLESFVVGPIAKKIVFSLLRNKPSKILMIVMMAFCMVIGMVTFMSMYGLASSYYANGLGGESLLGSYFSIFLKNFVFALPLQLLIVGPTVRFLYGKIKANQMNKSLSSV
ncbi:hypothetical protein [Paenibacillus sp. cl141a]|uniref:hypothetical protein n=1 Tax=Paenibacillus sp. cl141a TaxID=1761877 RepID=UPI000B8111CA|nr:hypothetical protein [Paenibacillus sp. cl141a]